MKPPRNLALHKFGIVMLFIALALALFLSAKWGVAAISHSLAMNHLETWQEKHKTPSLQSWQWSYDALLLASKLDANNAEYQNDLGRFYDFSTAMMQGVNQSKDSLQHQAIDAFRLATSLNPSWAIAWANLALMKHKVGEMDGEFTLSANQALRLGAALAPVQIMMSEVAVAGWSELSVALRLTMLDNIHHVLQSRHGYKLIKTMKTYQSLAYFCMIFDDKSKDKFCKGY